MPKALIIYDTFTGHTRTVAEKIKKHLEDLDFAVDLFRDKTFNGFETVQEYDVIALGSPAHGGVPALTLKRKLKSLFVMDLAGKKLITFSSSGGMQSAQWVVEKLEAFMAPTKITPLTSIVCQGKPPADFDRVLEMSIQEQML
ncbi:MAG TPA: flavodoxin family protein [Candidatus Lokiarchaeia archaeon]|nr:flavodoxin family protein [Candidatus Lokiarchaeia archaeon]